MRPRLFNRYFLANFYGLHVRQFGSQSLVSGRLSLEVSSSTPKRKVVDELARHVEKRPISLRSSDVNRRSYGATVLASRDFTTWLNDESFMFNMLETLFKPVNNGQGDLQHLDILSGVVDGIGTKNLSSEPRTGFSILYGLTGDILPNLWDSESVDSSSESRAASVSFITNPLAGDTKPLEITLPLANTVFQDGRQSTLSASRWENRSQGPMSLKTTCHKSNQRIFTYGDCANQTSSHIPLLPVTPPRKVVASLGNIVSQVEVGGSTTPASRELETLIPKILDIRSKNRAAASSGPFGVWCWVIPAHVVEAKKLLDLKVFRVESSQSEAELALESIKLFSGLLSSGCRLHKILSGGGGWGLKQGLLSLDPETHYSLPGQDDDVEMFIKSFQERNNANSSGGLATPGSYLMFCIEPQWTDKDVVSSQAAGPTQTLSLGVAPHSDLAPNYDANTGEVDVVEGYFGATSATGLFLRNVPELPDINTKDEPAKSWQSFTTKVDVPRACFVTGGIR
ncbi:hypothetical protein F5X99DRAFT_374125 [Biscogniauxia marginata]|nr:hypothetical protein F5X99DRAFT_374125 [Biscogniauxia marginata]